MMEIRDDLNASNVATAYECCVVWGPRKCCDFAVTAIGLDEVARTVLALETFGRHGTRVLPHISQLFFMAASGRKVL